MNIVDHHRTAMHTVFDEVSKDARELNLAVVGSEVVGLLPLDAVLAASDFYCDRQEDFV